MAESGQPLSAIVLIWLGRDILDISTLVMLQKVIAFVSMTLLAIAAISDIKTFRIPNLLVIAIAALGIIRLVLLGDPIAAIYAVAFCAFILVIGFVLFSFRIVGGGDVKFLAATILLIRYADLFNFFILMGVVGALLSVVIVLIQNYLPLVAGPRLTMHLPKSRLAVPY